MDGKLEGAKIEYYADCGCSPNDSVIAFIGRFADNSKFFPHTLDLFSLFDHDMCIFGCSEYNKSSSYTSKHFILKYPITCIYYPWYNATSGYVTDN